MRGMQYRVGAVLLVLAIGILLAACFLLGAAHLTSSLTGEQQTPIVSAVLVAFTAVYTVVVTQWIKESVFGPVIILGFEQCAPWCVTSPLSLEREEVQVQDGQLAWPGDLHAYFFRVNVTNEGVGEARGCEVLLERV